MAGLLLVLITFSAVFVMPYQLADPANSKPDQSLRGARYLLQNPAKEQRIADPPTQEKTSPLLEDEADDHEMETTTATAEAPEARKIEKHHSSDKSVAVGGVIIGGLVTAIFAAVYCYIRVTRRKHNIRSLT